MIRKLTIFHDPGCGLCCGFSRWLEAQARWVAVEFVDFASERAREKFPGIGLLDAGRDVVVLADDGQWWQGTGAWLTCLWATREYRGWSQRLAAPVFQPLVRNAVHLLSQNRLSVSRLLRLRSDAQLAGVLDALPAAQCATGEGACELQPRAWARDNRSMG
jgi:predicted DCC family thiol-disulfide oxidoreductase YuxK